jgi:hypothetical protein
MDTAMNKNSRYAPRRIVALVAAVTALWVVGPVALANASDATSDQYSNPVHKVAADIGGGGNGPSAPQTGLQQKVVGGLPFTGLDVVALAAVAIALMSMGFALRRLTAERHAS